MRSAPALAVAVALGLAAPSAARAADAAFAEVRPTAGSGVSGMVFVEEVSSGVRGRTVLRVPGRGLRRKRATFAVYRSACAQDSGRGVRLGAWHVSPGGFVYAGHERWLEALSLTAGSVRVAIGGKQVACGDVEHLAALEGDPDRPLIGIAPLDPVGRAGGRGLFVARERGNLLAVSAVVSPRDAASGLPTGKARASADKASPLLFVDSWSFGATNCCAFTRCLRGGAVVCRGSVEVALGGPDTTTRLTARGKTVSRGRLRLFTSTT